MFEECPGNSMRTTNLEAGRQGGMKARHTAEEFMKREAGYANGPFSSFLFIARARKWKNEVKVTEKGVCGDDSVHHRFSVCVVSELGDDIAYRHVVKRDMGLLKCNDYTLCMPPDEKAAKISGIKPVARMLMTYVYVGCAER